MKKLTYAELARMFREHEANLPKQPITACIVFTEDSWPDQYSLESRTYMVSSNCKAFMPNMGGYSIFGTSLDGSDKGVRLDWYMAAEKGGKDGWKVDYCYIVD